MGNRAVITTKENFENNGIGVYVHWNGGRDSVEAFLKYCDLKGYREPESDNYGWARLCQTIANYFSDGLSIGIDTIDHLDCDNGDNGVYLIEKWAIVGREYHDWGEQKEYPLLDMLFDIDEAQPTGVQLGREFIKEKYNDNIVVISQDIIRREILNVHDKDNSKIVQNISTLTFLIFFKGSSCSNNFPSYIL